MKNSNIDMKKQIKNSNDLLELSGKDDLPLVTIVVVVYNIAPFVSRCINSIIHQNYNNLNILLVDDGSTDGSAEIVDQYAETDARIVAIHQKNAGPSVARNAGIDHAVGEFIVFVDGDDYLSPDYVDYMLDIERKTHADIVASRNCFFTGDSKQIEEDHIVSVSSEDATAEFFYPRIRLGAWNKMYRATFLKNNHLRFVTEMRAGEGLQFITHAASLANCVGMGERKVYHYRTNNSDSATTKPDVKRQGVGAIETVNYIAQHLSMCSSSSKVQRALEWHRWNTYGYCLRNIIAAGQQRQYRELYRECIRKRREGLPVVLKADVSLKGKIMAFAIAASPVLFAYLEQRKIQRHLRVVED